METRAMQHAVVTGASGFIGSHLVEALLARGCRVRALARANSEHRLGNLERVPAALRAGLEVRFADILDLQDLQRACAGADTVFHLAAQINVPYSMHAPMLFLQTNALGTQNALQCCLDLGIERIVVISSSEIYGGAATGALREDDPPCARSPYAASKIAAEQMARAYHCSYGVGAVVLRPFNTFGPRQSQRAVIPWIVRQALESGEVALGNLTPVRDFVFVSDTVAGMIAAATARGVEGETFNLATGRGISVAEIVAAVGRGLGTTLRVKAAEERTRNPRAEVWRLVGDASRAREHLGWEPRVPFADGLAAVLQSVQSVHSVHSVPSDRSVPSVKTAAAAEPAPTARAEALVA